MIVMNPTLIYVADPMCSWCWGFAPVLKALVKAFTAELELDVIAGGLRPGTERPMPSELRETILHHWHEVQHATGQEFTFHMDEDLIYDTEPACRAVVTVRTIARAQALPYLHAVHRAFYVDNLDVTHSDVLANLAEAIGIDCNAFLPAFESEAMRAAAWADFERARSMGINAFPAAVLQRGEEKKLLTLGYLRFNDLQPRVRRWLDAAV